MTNYDNRREALSASIQNVSQSMQAEVIQARGTVCIASALVLIADLLQEANEQNKGVGVWRDCMLRALTALINR